MSILEKRERAENANQVLRIMGQHGRKFFWSNEKRRFARFEVDARSAVWLVDDYTGARIFTAYAGRWRGFSHGGTMEGLVRDLAKYIRNGEQINPRHFGPWPEHYCNGDLWGYGLEAMQIVRLEVDATGAVAPRSKDMKVIKVKHRFEGGTHIVTEVQHVMQPYTDQAVTEGGDYVARETEAMVEREVDVLRTADGDKAEKVARSLRERHGIPEEGSKRDPEGK